jgi:hypothetical protein
MSDPSNLIDPSSIGREVFPWRKWLRISNNKF